jgi:hypothetical protein
MEHLCPLCNNSLARKRAKDYFDYQCSKYDSHFYAKRTHLDTNELLKIKVKLQNEDKSEWYFRINYDTVSTEVWTDENPNRIVIKQVFTPDFSDLSRLKSKIQTYMLFS